MKATGIVRRVADLERNVIPGECCRTLRIREDAPSYTPLTSFHLFLQEIVAFGERAPGGKR